MDIESYYMEFFNHNLSRDFLSIRGYPRDIKSPIPQVTMSRILDERLKFNNRMFYSISIIKDSMRYSDRLFFDFDLDDKNYKEIESSDDAVTYLTNTDILESPFHDVSMAYDYLKEEGFNPYVLFTSSKGFHLYCFFEPVLIENIGYISTKYAETLKSKLHLKTIDFAVNKDAHMRKARLPYSRHNKTDLFVTPCNVDDDISDILSDAVNPTIQDFHMSDYIAKGFSDDLIATDEEISKLLELEQQNIAKERELKKQSQKDIICHKDVDLSAIDMRILVKDVISDNFVKSMDKYDIYYCPFHIDSHHSAGCYEKRFHCSSCGNSWNYYDFIAEYYDLTESKDIMNELKKHL